MLVAIRMEHEELPCVYRLEVSYGDVVAAREMYGGGGDDEDKQHQELVQDSVQRDVSEIIEACVQAPGPDHHTLNKDEFGDELLDIFAGDGLSMDYLFQLRVAADLLQTHCCWMVHCLLLPQHFPCAFSFVLAVYGEMSTDCGGADVL